MNTRVLLVDDEEQYTELLAQRLETRSLTVNTASNGDDALAFLDNHEVDVVILDVMMPGKSGIETLREMKSMRPLTEVIMLTGDTTAKTAIDGMKLGAYDYLMKPTDLAELLEKIANAYKRKQEQEDRIRQAEVDRLVKTRGW
jgi:two-component system, OmpR family, response regulator CpxR